MISAEGVLSDALQRYGMRFTEIGTGGGCMALQTRLESGHWLVATDEGLMSLADRISHEGDLDADDESRPCGWSIGIYADGGIDSDGYPLEWSGQESISDLSDWDAYAADLADVIGKALKNFFG